MINWTEKGRGVFRGEVNGKLAYVLYEISGAWHLDGLVSNSSLSLKEILSYAESAVNEYASGVGFSVKGGGQSIYTNNRFRAINRGGFNTSMYGGSNNSMYTYDIVPLNRTLQQPASEFNERPDEVKIYPGETVMGKVMNDRSGKLITGVMTKRIANSDGNVIYYEVLDRETGTTKKIDPTSVAVYNKLHNSEINSSIGLDDTMRVVSENLKQYSVGAKDLIEESKKTKPDIFTRTIYREPTDEELIDLADHDLTPDDVVNGLTYTIVGRGINSPKRVAMIERSLRRLVELHPHNEVFIGAMKTFMNSRK